MYLSKLELHGFKSFASRTVVDFAEGVTVVVGPNGCGKSNIVDAVRWVIGEQRARILRSEKMENVIFNGTQTRRSLGMAEVLLTIENTRGILPTEYSEVTIGRRLYRSGDSEYLLNGVQCRLKDITDLFMDTGMGAGAYSVIELKMIEELLSENALDRRRLFEEAAGITKYKVRRTQTLRKLGNTQADLNRVRDLTEELERHVRSLQRQAQKASRFKTLRGELDILELALAQSEFDRLTAEKSKTEEDLKTVRDLLEEDSAQLASTEAEHEVLRTAHIEREQAMVSAQGKLAAHLEQLRLGESDERLLRERISVADRDIERLSKDREMATLRGAALEESRERLSEAIATADPTVQAAEESLGTAQANRDAAAQKLEEQRTILNRLRQEEREALSSRAHAQRELDRVGGRLEMLGDDLEALVQQREAMGDAVEVAAANANLAQERVASAASLKEEARTKRDASEELRNQRAVELDSAQQALLEAQRQEHAAAAEVNLLNSLLSSYEDFSESVQFLAAESDWTDAPLRSVADCLACDEAYRPALEAALGDYADCLVVEHRGEAESAIRKLKASEKGRATFVLLDRLSERDGLVAPMGIPTGLKALASVVRADGTALEALRDVLLWNVFLADSIDRIAGGLPAHARVFAPNGEWLSESGLLHGGSGDRAATASPAASRLGRREQLQQAEESLAAFQANRARASAGVQNAREALNEIDLDADDRALRQANERLAEAQQNATRSDLERESLKRRSADLAGRIEHLEKAGAMNRDELVHHAERLEQAEERLTSASAGRETAELGFQTFENDNREAAAQFSEAKVTAVQARNHLDNLVRDHRRALEGLEQLAEESEARAKRLEQLAVDRKQATESLTALVGKLAEMRREQAAFDQGVSATKERLNETKAAISEVEARLRTIRRAREENMRQENRLAVREAEISTRLEDLVASVLEDFDVELAPGSATIPEDFVEGDARIQVQELRRKIRNLGPVNELALDAFEEERERLTFLQTQLQDLEKAESTLLETIDEINTTASKRFETTFESIRGSFTRLFVELFGEEASADIVLEDAGDPLESAIEILAKPSGKKPSVLAQLSGGEKTLTAISLLFAIYLVKPSPFCILDEVDAPLDDANVDRFMHLIRSFSESTQFILVTHNKRTMEAADRMYGITMQEQGVSRLVGVSFEDEEESLELVA